MANEPPCYLNPCKDVELGLTSVDLWRGQAQSLTLVTVLGLSSEVEAKAWKKAKGLLERLAQEASRMHDETEAG